MKIAFNTANLVARVSGYHFQLSNWMDQHHRTVAKTDEAEFREICREIAQAGFRAVELWQAHADPSRMDEGRAGTWREIMDDAGLTPIAYAGQPTKGAVQVCRWLGISVINGGLGDVTIDEAEANCRDAGLRFNCENHPEKSVAEMVGKIRGGNEIVGICIDTGWLGTQGVEAAKTMRELGPLIRHVHVKDVKAAGGHETCALGQGIVNVPAVIETLKDLGYDGWYSWEDEPEDRNPFDIAAEMRGWIGQQLGGKRQ